MAGGTIACSSSQTLQVVNVLTMVKQAGWQPHHQPIDQAHGLQHRLPTSLPVEHLAGDLTVLPRLKHFERQCYGGSTRNLSMFKALGQDAGTDINVV